MPRLMENNWLVVWNMFYISIYWEQSSQLTFTESFFRGVGLLPTSHWLAKGKSTSPTPLFLEGWDGFSSDCGGILSACRSGRSGICGFLWPHMRSAMPATNCWIVFQYLEPPKENNYSQTWLLLIFCLFLAFYSTRTVFIDLERFLTYLVPFAYIVHKTLFICMKSPEIAA